jgi:opacity protein-like surface antigen
MKYILLCGTACAVLAAANPAAAQNNHYGKDSDTSLLNQSHSYNATEPAPQKQASNTLTGPDTSASTVSRIEPAAGDNDMGSEYADFTGPYFGVDAGYNFGSADIELGPGPSDDGSDLNGWDAGVFIGYGMEQNMVRWLGGYLGFEIGYEMSNADGDFAGVDYEKDHNWLATIRPGFAYGHDALLYGIAGYSRANYEVEGDDEDFNGYVLGLGSEINTHTAAKIRLEYTYANYGEEDFGAVEFEPVENNVKLGVVFQF